jgi:hypothetical protein
MIVVPVTHDLIHFATVHTARLALSLLDEVAEERGAWRKRQMIDVAVQAPQPNGLRNCQMGHSTRSGNSSGSRARGPLDTRTRVKRTNCSAFIRYRGGGLRLDTALLGGTAP